MADNWLHERIPRLSPINGCRATSQWTYDEIKTYNHYVKMMSRRRFGDIMHVMFTSCAHWDAPVNVHVAALSWFVNSLVPLRDIMSHELGVPVNVPDVPDHLHDERVPRPNPINGCQVTCTSKCTRSIYCHGMLFVKGLVPLRDKMSHWVCQ